LSTGRVLRRAPNGEASDDAYGSTWRSDEGDATEIGGKTTGIARSVL
jgi:hypothetical protein